MHFENGDISAGLVDGEGAGIDLDVDALVLSAEGLFEELVVVGGPDGVDGKARDEVVIAGLLGFLGELLDEQVVQLGAVAMAFVGVILGERDEIVFAIDLEVEVAGDAAHETFPIDETRGAGESGAGEECGAAFDEGVSVVANEGVGFDLGHTGL